MRSPISAIDKAQLRKIQTGTMHYYWRGVMCNKNPFDLALYPQLLWNLKPRTIIEIGSKMGGSALWLTDISKCHGIDVKVLSIDIDQRAEVSHPQIEFVQGDGRNLGTVLTPERMASLPRPWFVIEDADHHYVTTLAVLNFFADKLQPGEYLTVEDGICDSLGNEARYDGGPNRAIAEFVDAHPEIYEVDKRYCDHFGYNVTWCTNGWLRRRDPSEAVTLEKSETQAPTAIAGANAPASSPPAPDARPEVKVDRWKARRDALMAEVVAERRAKGETVGALERQALVEEVRIRLAAEREAERRSKKR
jgi:cephalosporin hydroxylase